MVRNSITWWQLSDLHWPCSPEPEREQYIAVLLDHLRDVHANEGSPDFVIFTGDIAQSGRAEEYDSVSEVLFAPLRAIVGEDTPLLFVPGNHDMDREEAQFKAAHLVTDLKDADAVDAFLKHARQRDNFGDPFRNYETFVRRWGPAGTEDVYHWSHDVVVAGRRCRVLGINSAWSGYYHAAQSGTDDDRGRLLLSISQIPRLESDVDYALFAQHHPFDWLHQQISAPAVQRLRLEYQAGLFGHLHDPRDTGMLTTPQSRLLRVPSMLLFGRPHGDYSAEFARGYARGELLFEKNRCRIRYFKYDNVHSGRFREYTDVYPEGKGASMETLQPLHHQPASTAAQQVSTSSLVTLLPRIRQMQSLIPDLCDLDGDSAHTLGVFQNLLELIDSELPLTAFGDGAQVALAHVAAELTIVHGSSGMMLPGGEAGSTARVARALEPLAEMTDEVTDKDITALCRLLGHLSLDEPEHIRRAGDLRGSQAADSFAFLWGLARLAQLLDNPGLMDADAIQLGQYRKNVLGVRRRQPSDGTLVFDLLTTDRRSFHLTAEAQHLVGQYFTELENVWRSWQVVRPPVRFELNTPHWRDRSLRNHELRVDARPITRLLMGSALYGDRPHVWLRELVQNAVDATEMRAATSPSGYEPRIDVHLEDAHRLVIRDNGVGMTYQQVVSQLSVLGRSGWRDAVAKPTEAVTDGPAIFGRFGIGFASVFSVATAVEVRTRTADSRPVDGILVQFSTPDRPFYTDHTTCEPGTEIRVQLADSLTSTAFRDAMTDLFAYLPSSVNVSPDLRMPSTLTEFSPLDRKRKHLNGWSVQRRQGTTHLGPYPVDFQLDVIHDPRPQNRKEGHVRSQQRSGSQHDRRPNSSELGRTSVTFCVDGIRITEHVGLHPNDGGRPRSDEMKHGHLTGCHLTVDFRRDNAPVTASRNALESDEELHKEVVKLVQTTVADMLTELVHTVQANCANDAARRRAAYRALRDTLIGWDSYRPDSYQSWGGFHASPELSRAAAEVYVKHCPVTVRSANGMSRYVPLAEVDPTHCSVATTTKLAQHDLFPTFARAAGLNDWIVALEGRELNLIEEAWPHEPSLKVVSEPSHLMDDFQTILPEVREGHLWQLLRSDYALSESQIFGDALVVPLPTRRNTVKPADGVARRRLNTAQGERPRKLLNRRHPVLLAVEQYLGRTATADDSDTATAVNEVIGWLDLLCDQVLDEDRVTVRRERWNQLRLRLRDMTGESFSGTSADALHLSWADTHG
ncbi:metallophosphoesterase [Streptomyces sp. NPDC057623]|uniref:metallophosphoesterase family protein n=1 Tax=Streptomyces sp. NPDC057623 TaxID=3346187 RepID=UPI0036766F72